jgi:hypothetical protein
MLRWWLGIALASVAASTALGFAFAIQQAIEGPSAAMMDLRDAASLFRYVALTSVFMLGPVALFGALADSALVRLGGQSFWAYALGGLLTGALIGWLLATVTPQSEGDEGVIAKVWHLGLFGLMAASTFWWVVRRSADRA